MPNAVADGCKCCSKMFLQSSLYMVPSMKTRSPTPPEEKQAHTTTDPPPCLTVGRTQSSLYSSWGFLYTRARPSDRNSLKLDSSEKITFLQYSIGSLTWALANCSRRLMWSGLRYGL